MDEPIQVAVVDDHPIFRDGVVATLKRVPEFDVVAVGASANDAVLIAEKHLPDVMLMDINMPGSGIDAAKKICSSCPVIKILMLTISENVDDLLAALEAGARGYILKGVSGPDLVKTMIAVHRGDSYVTPSLAARVLSRMTKAPARASAPKTAPCDDRLTFREEQILKQVSDGLTNKEIARKLQLSEKTVKHYVTNILQKLQVRNRVEAALSFKKKDATVKNAQ
jgi:DNA-binding NarL/FixJ family response regulator